LIKGGEVGEVEEVTGDDRTQDLTLDLRIQSVLQRWRRSRPVIGRWGE
jgi:hypothetical protein